MFECIFFSPCSCMAHGCFMMALNAREAMLSASYSQGGTSKTICRSHSSQKAEMHHVRAQKNTQPCYMLGVHICGKSM